MKINKTIMAVALGLSMASLANAGTVYFTGSTAMRSTIFNALTNVGTVFSSAPTFTGFGASGGSDTYMAFQGSLVGDPGSTTIKCHWSGSEAGILDVASNNVSQEQFIADSALNGVDNAGSPTAGQLTALTNVDLAMADNKQTYSKTKAPSLTGTEVGVVTFEWIRNPGTWTGSNVTDSQIRQALLGACPIGVFNGTATTNSFVYVEGRDTSSGTRVNALGESGFGIGTGVLQVEINNTGAMLDINSDGTYQGNFGFSSGSGISGTMGVNTASAADLTANGAGQGGTGTNGFSLIAYVGISDGNTATNNGATVLTYNGVPFSAANVENGTYTFWGNEYIYKSPSAGTEAQTVYTDLSSISHGLDILFDGIKAIPLDLMQCSRPGPTGDPAHY